MVTWMHYWDNFSKWQEYKYFDHATLVSLLHITIDKVRCDLKNSHGARLTSMKLQTVPGGASLDPRKIIEYI